VNGLNKLLEPSDFKVTEDDLQKLSKEDAKKFVKALQTSYDENMKWFKKMCDKEIAYDKASRGRVKAMLGFWLLIMVAAFVDVFFKMLWGFTFAYPISVLLICIGFFIVTQRIQKVLKKDLNILDGKGKL